MKFKSTHDSEKPLPLSFAPISGGISSLNLIDRRVRLPSHEISLDVLKTLLLSFLKSHVGESTQVRLHDDFVALQEIRVHVRFVGKDVESGASDFAGLEGVLFLH